MASIYSILHLFNSLLPRILIGFQIDPTGTSKVYCKLNIYLSNQFSLTAQTFLILATVDRYLCSCRQLRYYREWKKVKSIRIVIGITIIFYILLLIPHLIFYDTNSDNACSPTSNSFNYYVIYFMDLILITLTPIVATMYFGLNTCINIRQQRKTVHAAAPHTTIVKSAIRNRMEKQTMRMLLLQIFVNCISSTPLLVQSIYASATLQNDKDLLLVAQENLFKTIVRLLSYVTYTAGFYINFISSSEIRRILKEKVHRRHYSTTQVTTDNHTAN
ncbi:unnamed protein product [Didymodactylos carnosus]|uniref:G-protein coupled receptors family 1 profile domain-containing protein n=1 Tax=Didymodactylos carnosus TaxID=1234261 RepID=A0A8S2QLD5_9BILA|nr:unnamed protein product [Didymodactylos carnosus]CAF4105236.1 unnamed protein product [Didymodactylos carnosus]